MNKTYRRLIASAFCLLPAGYCAAEDWPMWGRTPSRSMVSSEKNPPTEWDVESGKNIRWSGQLGSQSYGNPVVHYGLVFVGTNNEAHHDPKYDKDGGALIAFSEKDGKFLYQRYTPKHPAGRVVDWPYQGICSTVYAEGDNIWYCTSRCEVVCLNVKGLMDGSGSPKEVWVVDMMSQLGVFPHNMTSCSITAHEDMVYVITGNGVDDTHKNLPAPQAPSIIAFNKHDGKVVWTDNTPGENVLHGQWSSPAIAVVNGRAQVICPLGDGWIYSYDAKTGKKIWWFDSNKKDTVYPTTRNELIATPVIIGNRCYIANGQDPEHGEGPGHMWCIDITKEGDVSAEISDAPKPKPGEELIAPEGTTRKGKPNLNSAVVWSYQSYDANKDGRVQSRERMNRTISTVVVYNGLVFAPDFSGFLHVLDAETGQHQWTYDMEAAMWGSPLAIDGKIYLCDEEGDVVIFEAARKEKVIASHNLGSASYCSPIYANGTLYVMNKDHIFAIGEKK